MDSDDGRLYSIRRGHLHSCRRGPGAMYRIDEAKHQVEIHSIRHRRDAYRA